MRSYVHFDAAFVAFTTACVFCIVGHVPAQEEVIPQPIQAWLQSAEDALAQKDYEGAHAFYANIVSAYPGTDYAMDAQCRTTILYLQRGRKEQADAAVEQMWDYGDHPAVVAILERIKSAYWGQGYKEESQALCRRIMEAYPTHPDTAIVHRDAICGYIAMKDLAQASALLETFCELYGARADIVKLLEKVGCRVTVTNHRRCVTVSCRPTRPIRILRPYTGTPSQAVWL
jgi:tetratricopeptide (TPR) repeat protein